ncbi:ADYC domain-containing protein [Nevskia ramosa]|uniref:ADYC domain-containing protein n=1 Tax=Nevskia ramosa TaxID=64002 RepID=UPI0003B72C17|nr:ADYC domain-containing protein [Nevskia ramosa]
MNFNPLRHCSLLMLLALAAQAAPQTVTAPDMSAEHTAFVLKLADGRVLRGQQMQGAVVHMGIEGGKLASIKLASIKPDPQDPDILRHEFQVQNDKGEWQPACQPNFYGETWGFPISLPEHHPGREGAITLTCASGAVGKCIRFGYKPWALGPKGEDLTPYHAACVHMVRADYAGDGEPHTKNGTNIDVYDRIGIQSSESKADPSFGFEAGWSPTGAVCVAHTRWADVITTEALWKAVPRLAAPCTEDAAARLGALLFNRSKLGAEQ